MNGKRAKLLRKVGKLDKHTKRLYNRLSHVEKGLLSAMYTDIITRLDESVVVQPTPELQGVDGPSVAEAIDKSMEINYS